VIQRVGQGTRVADDPPVGAALPLRQAALIHQAESFLLGALTAGHTLNEIERAVRLAMDRWRSLSDPPAAVTDRVLRFNGSHDPAVTLLADQVANFAPGCRFEVVFSGSLGGLMALARQECDLAGCHLWDAETGEYNTPFVQRLLPGRRVALLTLAHRQLGLIVPPGNPAGLHGLADLGPGGPRLINRQPGAGTRVWLDAQLHARGIAPEQLPGYDDCVRTHAEVASAIAEGRAEVGLGLETAALTYGLGFVPLTVERYDLVIPAEGWDTPPVQGLMQWLAFEASRAAIRVLGGYETDATGGVQWVGEV
jgi:putative molybdopterin biosynthesis protein